MSLQLFINLIGESQTRIIHCQQETFDFKMRVELRLYDADGVEQFADAFKGKILSLDRDDY